MYPTPRNCTMFGCTRRHQMDISQLNSFSAMASVMQSLLSVLIATGEPRHRPHRISPKAPSPTTSSTLTSHGSSSHSAVPSGRKYTLWVIERSRVWKASSSCFSFETAIAALGSVESPPLESSSAIAWSFCLVAFVMVTAPSASSSESEPSCGPFIFFTLMHLAAASGVAGASVEDDCDDNLDGTLVGLSTIDALTRGEDPMKLSGSMAMVLYCLLVGESRPGADWPGASS